MTSNLVPRLLVAFLVLAAALTAAPLERDLGEGLAYYRTRALPADLPTLPAKGQPLVLDLRFAVGDADAATALAAWLKFHAAPPTPVFVLLNAATAPELRQIFAGARPPAAVITLGPSSLPVPPDVAIDAPADTEKLAYDALEHGTTVESLTHENPDKPRNDEASIMSERTHASDDAAPPEPDELAASAPDPAAARPPVLIDRSLQRAIHLHRGLHALKRL